MIIDGSGLHIDGGEDYYSVYIKSSNLDEPIKNLLLRLSTVWEKFANDENYQNVADFCNQFIKISENYPETKYPEIALRYVSDSFVLLQDYKNAVRFFPQISLKERSSGLTESLLSLKFICNMPLGANEVFSLFGPQITEFGGQFLTDIYNEVELFLKENPEKAKYELLSDWASHARKFKYQVGSGHVLGYYLSKRIKINGYLFSENLEIKKYFHKITRNAENKIRKQMGFVGVGEGWIGETKLYYEIKAIFLNLEIEQHARPDWLGYQHIDIYIPAIRIAIEYQGEQHDKPIKLFGGQEAYLANVERDKRKQRLCKENGVHLIYVRAGYLLNDIVEEIKTRM